MQSCAIVSERADLTAALTAALEARSIACHTVAPARNFVGAASALRAATAVEGSGPLDAVVVALAGHAAGSAGTRRSAGAAPAAEWQAVLADHHGLIAHLLADAAWTRAAADYAAESERPVRIVTLTDATTPGGRSRAQASAQIARAAAGGTGRRVTALATSLESSEAGADERSGQLVAHLLAHPEAGALAGAELVVGPGWLGLRAHPRPIGTVVYGGPEIPGWLDGALREIVGAPGAGSEEQTGGRMTDTRQKPTRVVDAHVHLWDPARTDWYPYLSQPGQLGQEGIKREGASGMFRRFDADTYRAESARMECREVRQRRRRHGARTPSTRPWS